MTAGTKVGEIYATLTIDDQQFQQGLQRGQTGMQNLQQVAERTAQVARASAQQAAAGYRTLVTAVEQAGTAAQSAHRASRQAAERAEQADRDLADARQRLAAGGDELRRTEERVADAHRDAQQAADRASAAQADYAQASRRAAEGAEDLQQRLRAAGTELRGLDGRASQGVEGLRRIADAADDSVRSLSRVEGAASDAGGDAGQGFLDGFKDTLGDLGSKTGPIAGSILGIAALGVGVGVALAQAIKDGMDAELSRDLFQAQTGVTEAQAKKFAQAAGESYADVFGESLEANLSTIKVGLENGLLDPGSTQRDAQKVINSLSGVADILGEEIPAVAAAAGHAIKSGWADSMDEALDIMVRGSQVGLNVSEDWLDTINEYSVQFEKLGLTGAEAMGLMKQALEGGARDTDLAADALKEFAIRASDASDTSAEGFQAMGLNAEEMTAKFASGGRDAAEGLDQVLDGLRAIEDPVQRNTVAVALFGTQAEDLAGALAKMDLDAAAVAMNNYAGAAERAINVMGDNAATSVEGTMRSISTVTDGLKAAIAEAFGSQIQEWANSVSNNRAGVIEFLQSVMNGAFEAGKSFLSFSASALDAFSTISEFGTKMTVGLLDGLRVLAGGFDAIANLIPGVEVDASGAIGNLSDAIERLGTGASDGMHAAAEDIRNEWLPTLDQVQERANEAVGGMRTSAAFDDQIAKTVGAIASIGKAADGTLISLENWSGAIDQSNVGQSRMQSDIVSLADAFKEQARTGLEAGETVESLTALYTANRGSLLDQLGALGMSRNAAETYITSLGLVPNLVETQIRTPGMPEAHYGMDVLKGKVIDTPDDKTIHTKALTADAIAALEHLGFTVRENTEDGTMTVTADTAPAEQAMEEFRRRNSWFKVTAAVENIRIAPTADWSQPQPRADGGVDLPDQATMGDGKRTLYQWNEPETDGEAFIPLALAKRRRSKALLRTVAKLFGMGVVEMADGGLTAGALDSQSRGIEGATYVWGGWDGSWNTDCSGAASKIANMAVYGDPMTGGRFATGNEAEALASRGFKDGPGPEGSLRIGWQNGGPGGGHTASTLPNGVNVEMGGARGNGQYGGSAAGAMDFPNIMHLPMVPSVGVGDGGDPRFDLSGLGSPGYDSMSGTTSSSSSSGAAQDVRVVNWPKALGGEGDDALAKPIATFSGRLFADGGLEDHTAHITNRLRVFGEPETGGEAYIPLALSKRARSLAILAQTAGMMGKVLVDAYALGGFGGVGQDGDGGVHTGSWKVATLGDQTAGPLSTPNSVLPWASTAMDAQKLLGFGAGLAFTAASGWDSSGKFVGFNTGNNNIPGADRMIELLETIAESVVNQKPVDVNVDIDSGRRTAELNILQRGL